MTVVSISMKDIAQHLFSFYTKKLTLKKHQLNFLSVSQASERLSVRMSYSSQTASCLAVAGKENDKEYMYRRHKLSLESMCVRCSCQNYSEITKNAKKINLCFDFLMSFFCDNHDAVKFLYDFHNGHPLNNEEKMSIITSFFKRGSTVMAFVFAVFRIRHVA